MQLRFTQFVKIFLIVNAAVFILTMVKPELEALFALYNFNSPYYYPFQLLTNVFTHSGFMHLLWNMLPLVFFGPYLEDFLGSKRFGSFVMISGIGVSIGWLIFQSIDLQNGAISAMQITRSVVGFSGVTAAILTLTALYFPNMEIRIYFVLPVKIKYIVLIYFAYQVYAFYNAPVGSNTSYISHILGAVFAVILFKAWEIIDSRR